MLGAGRKLEAPGIGNLIFILSVQRNHPVRPFAKKALQLGAAEPNVIKHGSRRRRTMRKYFELPTYAAIHFGAAGKDHTIVAFVAELLGCHPVAGFVFREKLLATF